MCFEDYLHYWQFEAPRYLRCLAVSSLSVKEIISSSIILCSFSFCVWIRWIGSNQRSRFDHHSKFQWDLPFASRFHLLDLSWQITDQSWTANRIGLPGFWPQYSLQSLQVFKLMRLLTQCWLLTLCDSVWLCESWLCDASFDSSLPPTTLSRLYTQFGLGHSVFQSLRLSD